MKDLLLKVAEPPRILTQILSSKIHSIVDPMHQHHQSLHYPFAQGDRTPSYSTSAQEALHMG
jgi:hypothetical protein